MTLDQISARIIGDLLADARFTYADHRVIADVVRTTVNAIRVNIVQFDTAIAQERARKDLAATEARLLAAIEKIETTEKTC